MDEPPPPPSSPDSSLSGLGIQPPTLSDESLFAPSPPAAVPRDRVSEGTKRAIDAASAIVAVSVGSTVGVAVAAGAASVVAPLSSSLLVAVAARTASWSMPLISMLQHMQFLVMTGGAVGNSSATYQELTGQLAWTNFRYNITRVRSTADYGPGNNDAVPSPPPPSLLTAPSPAALLAAGRRFLLQEQSKRPEVDASDERVPTPFEVTAYNILVVVGIIMLGILPLHWLMLRLWRWCPCLKRNNATLPQPLVFPSVEITLMDLTFNGVCQAAGALAVAAHLSGAAAPTVMSVISFVYLGIVMILVVTLVLSLARRTARSHDPKAVPTTTAAAAPPPPPGGAPPEASKAILAYAPKTQAGRGRDQDDNDGRQTVASSSTSPAPSPGGKADPAHAAASSGVSPLPPQPPRRAGKVGDGVPWWHCWCGTCNLLGRLQRWMEVGRWNNLEGEELAELEPRRTKLYVDSGMALTALVESFEEPGPEASANQLQQAPAADPLNSDAEPPVTDPGQVSLQMEGSGKGAAEALGKEPQAAEQPAKEQRHLPDQAQSLELNVAQQQPQQATREGAGNGRAGNAAQYNIHAVSGGSGAPQATGLQTPPRKPPRVLICCFNSVKDSEALDGQAAGGDKAPARQVMDPGAGGATRHAAEDRRRMTRTQLYERFGYVLMPYKGDKWHSIIFHVPRTFTAIIIGVLLCAQQTDDEAFRDRVCISLTSVVLGVKVALLSYIMLLQPFANALDAIVEGFTHALEAGSLICILALQRKDSDQWEKALLAFAISAFIVQIVSLWLFTIIPAIPELVYMLIQLLRYCCCGGKAKDPSGKATTAGGQAGPQNQLQRTQSQPAPTSAPGQQLQQQPAGNRI